ncbi:MAG: hypothetical protein ACKOUM_12010 [Sphingopyxis sp.]
MNGTRPFGTPHPAIVARPHGRTAWVRLVLCALLAWAALWTAPATAQSCAAATTQGTAPAGWQTYCWLDFSTYNNTTARSAAGQPFAFTLTDGTVLSFTLTVTPAASTGYAAIAAPSWSGAAVGNTAFLGIPGRPILYTTAAGTSRITISSIAVTPPPGVSAVTTYSFVVADAEATNSGETLRFTTNGSVWQILDQVDPISGSAYPTISGTGTSVFTETGAAGTVGGYIVGSTSPTNVSVDVTAGGLQGVMFAVRFASIRLTKQIVGARINAADQFTFRISATGSGSTMATGTTTGTGLGPFTAAAVSLASGLPLTVSETMAAGSVSAMAQYRSMLNCVNGAPSSTVMPTNVQTTSYNFGSLQFGDSVQCTFTNTPYPHIRLIKALGAGGRLYAGDQFVVRMTSGEAATASSTTSGTGTTVTGGDTGLVQLAAGASYALSEAAAGTTTLALYTPTMACTNAAGASTTVLPTSAPGTITPALGDVITCTINNTRRNTALLQLVKTSTILSDPVNGATNPKFIPGAIVEYAITVTNIGNTAVDASSLALTDPMPATVNYDSGTPVTFTNGATASGLNAFNAATMVSYSSQTGGAAPYGYTPNGSFDANARGMRVAPTGTMAAAASATAQPSFTIRFRARVN